ncbi:hypothetical protein HT746_20110 [Burkholderia pyrrocinia]|uniref:hypothetical protein n=1 Tax=Burkholderia pyrrocinia TaxID=60550 RepID=UPI001576104A|nr:hypothetical protein [Burkholderia pyrrocinia]NTX29398.1 hypothetical protein [Burkholderia pyrrocinia]
MRQPLADQVADEQKHRARVARPKGTAMRAPATLAAQPLSVRARHAMVLPTDTFVMPRKFELVSFHDDRVQRSIAHDSS